MAQTSYSLNMTEGMLGLIANSEYTLKESHVALSTIPFGYGVCFGDAAENTTRLPLASKTTIVFSGDFDADNVINLKVNGVSITQVARTTDQATTAGLLAAAISALSGVTGAIDTTDTNNRTFIVTTDDAVCTLTDVAATGTGTVPTNTLTVGNKERFLGGSVQSQPIEQNDDGSVAYIANKIVPVMRKGKIWVYTEEAVKESDSVYLRFITNGTNVPGYFRKSSDSDKAFLLSNVKFRKRTTGAGLTILELNQ